MTIVAPARQIEFKHLGQKDVPLTAPVRASAAQPVAELVAPARQAQATGAAAPSSPGRLTAPSRSSGGFDAIGMMQALEGIERPADPFAAAALGLIQGSALKQTRAKEEGKRAAIAEQLAAHPDLARQVETETRSIEDALRVAAERDEKAKTKSEAEARRTKIAAYLSDDPELAHLAPIYLDGGMDDDTLGRVIIEMSKPKETKAPTIVETYDPVTGQPVKGYMDGTTFVPVGGVKAPGDSLVTVNTGDGGNGGASVGQFQKDLGGLMAKDYIGIRDEAKAARTALGTLDAMETSLQDPSFYSGFGADQLLTLKRFGASLGIDPEGVASMETFGALNKQAALAAMGGSLGTGFSNADRDFVVEQVPSSANTPEGNKQLIDIQRKINQRKVEIAELATEYVEAHGVLDAGFEEQLQQYAETNPLFPKTPQITTQQEYDALPSGAPYLDPAGNLRTKG